MVRTHSEAIPFHPMSRRIDIELTSALDDGSWTWRAAGAKQPKGVLDGTILPGGSKVGDEIKVEVEQQLEGLTVLAVVSGRDKQDRGDVIELLPAEREFQPVVETRAKRERGERPGGRGGDRRPRRDRDGGGRGDRDAAGRGDRDRAPRPDGEHRQRRDRRDGSGGPGENRGRPERGRRGPSFTPPPEVPQRPKPKRLRPGKAHRSAVLDDLPVEQRAIAELALQGMPAVRQRLKEENQRATAEGRAPMPEASVLKLAEELLPRLRVAEWRDRAEAAQRQMAELDLRDLRSVVAAAGDPMVARDDTTRPLVEELQAALATKQEQELALWFGDVDAALAVGRVVRALRLSSQPPKAGVVFPSEIKQRLIDSTNASLAPMDSPDRWIAMLEAAAFSPVRTQIRPLRKPDVVSDELLAAVTRLGPALPQVAEVFEVEIDPKAPMPKPLRPGPPRGKRDQQKPGDGAKGKPKSGDRPKRGAAPGDTTSGDATTSASSGNARTTTEDVAAADVTPASTDPAGTGETVADQPAPEAPTEATNDATPDTAAPTNDATTDQPAPEAPTDATPDTEAPTDPAGADETTADQPAPEATTDATPDTAAPTNDATTDRTTTEAAPDTEAPTHPAGAGDGSVDQPTDAPGVTDAPTEQPATDTNTGAPTEHPATDTTTTGAPSEPPATDTTTTVAAPDEASVDGTADTAPDAAGPATEAVTDVPEVDEPASEVGADEPAS
jgi:hypothetical protein